MDAVNSSFFNDLFSQAAKGLGIDTGANAAKTIGNVARDLLGKDKADPAPPAATTPVVQQVMGFYDQNKTTILYVGAGIAALALALLIFRRK